MTKEKGGHPALFLDLDDTVRKTVAGGRPFPIAPHEQELMEGRYEKIWAYKKKGYKILGVTNQGGIGMGTLSKKECEACFDDLNKKLDGAFDDIAYAAAHPEKDDPFRKPNPGMLHALEEKHGIHLGKSLMVGDRDTDKMAAHRAGVKFIWAKDFFNGTNDEKT